MSYLRNQNQKTNENLNEFEDNTKQTNYATKDTNLYNKYKENVANQRFKRSAEGIPAISAEDFAILRQCNRESFWYRCIPMSVGICALMFYLAKQTNIKPKIWHILSGTFGGWFVGKLSYRRTCTDRLIHSDSHSPFVTAMRRRQGVFKDDQSGSGMSSETNIESDDQFWDNSKDNMFGYGSQEFGDYKSEETQRNESNEEPKAYTTYDDLRAKNRATYKPNNSRTFNQ